MSYDAAIIGAGSVGVPIAMVLAEQGLKPLVIDMNASPGQGENKHAIGGVRATHSDPGKIMVGRRSLEILSSWEERYGDPIEWLKGGYAFPLYREADTRLMKGLLPVQQSYGLNIDFIEPRQMREQVPGINPDGLLGGTFSPDDGSISPLLTINAFFRRAVELGADFHFKERVTGIVTKGGRIGGLQTDRGLYEAPVVIDAAGPYSSDIGKMAGTHLSVTPDSHEAAITEPVKPFFSCMVVDIRPGPDSKNFYFYQNRHGQVVFCITPHPPIVGTAKGATSTFLPQVCARMVDLLPRLKNLRVRRTWRGLYPMTPDGSPLVGWNRDVEGLIHAAGMCGQGLMLGPGIAELIGRMVTDQLADGDPVILDEFSPYREFKEVEALK
jgi:sarcosine oxidase subunit beta